MKERVNKKTVYYLSLGNKTRILLSEQKNTMRFNMMKNFLKICVSRNPGFHGFHRKNVHTKQIGIFVEKSGEIIIECLSVSIWENQLGLGPKIASNFF